MTWWAVAHAEQRVHKAVWPGTTGQGFWGWRQPSPSSCSALSGSLPCPLGQTQSFPGQNNEETSSTEEGERGHQSPHGLRARPCGRPQAYSSDRAAGRWGCPRGHKAPTISCLRPSNSPSAPSPVQARKAFLVLLSWPGWPPSCTQHTVLGLATRVRPHGSDCVPLSRAKVRPEHSCRSCGEETASSLHLLPCDP